MDCIPSGHSNEPLLSSTDASAELSGDSEKTVDDDTLIKQEVDKGGTVAGLDVPSTAPLKAAAAVLIAENHIESDEAADDGRNNICG